MPKFILLLILLYGIASPARENPFFPAEGMKDMTVTSSDIQTFTPLQRAAISMPDSARVLKEVKVTYQNLDGSIGTKTISLDNSIDWHLPLFISQSYNATKPDVPESNQTKPAEPVPAYSTLVNFGEAAFYQSGKSLKIVTKDPLIRNFMMVNPHRIVLDFKRNADFRSKTHVIHDGKPYKEIRLGNHKGYYRTVIELDGQYRYNLQQESGSLIITCY